VYAFDQRSHQSSWFLGRHLEPRLEFLSALEDLERTPGQAVDVGPALISGLLTTLPSVDLTVDPTSQIGKEDALVVVQVQISHYLCSASWDLLAEADHITWHNNKARSSSIILSFRK
jgi:hypothetical protein